MRTMFLSVLLIIPAILSAFEHPKQIGIAYIYSDKVNVRENPGLSGKVITNISAGTEIEILSKCDNFDRIDQSIVLDAYFTNGNGTIKKAPVYTNSFVDYWYKIKINDLTGFVWGGFIANNYLAIDKNSMNFLVLIRNFSEHVSYSYHIDQTKFHNRGDNKDALSCKFIENNKIIFEKKDLYAMGEARFKNITYEEYEGFDDPVFLLKIDYEDISEYGEGSGERFYLLSANSIDQEIDAWAGGEGGSRNEYKIIYPTNPKGKHNEIIVEYTFYDEQNNKSSSAVEYIWDSKNKKFFKK